MKPRLASQSREEERREEEMESALGKPEAFRTEGGRAAKLGKPGGFS
jgi:hypothetical protein